MTSAMQSLEEAADPSSWKTFRRMVQQDDYYGVTAELCAALGFESKVQLLPVIRGMLAFIVREDDNEKNPPKIERRRPGFAAFAKASGADKADRASEHGGVDANVELTGARRRWASTLKEMFTADAAVCFQADALEKYRSPEFSYEAAIMDSSWTSEVPISERSDMIGGLCLKFALEKLLPLYGFSGDTAGWKEAKSMIDILAKSDKNLKVRKDEFTKFLINQFPHLTSSDSEKAGASRRTNRAGSNSAIRRSPAAGGYGAEGGASSTTSNGYTNSTSDAFLADTSPSKKY